MNYSYNKYNYNKNIKYKYYAISGNAMNKYFKLKKSLLFSLLILILSNIFHLQAFVSYYFLINDAGKLILLLGDRHQDQFTTNNKLHIDHLIEVLKRNKQYASKPVDFIFEFAAESLNLLRLTGNFAKGTNLSVSMHELIKYADTTTNESPIKIKPHDPRTRESNIVNNIASALVSFAQGGQYAPRNLFKPNWIDFKKSAIAANINALDQRVTVETYKNNIEKYSLAIQYIRDRYDVDSNYYKLIDLLFEKYKKAVIKAKGYFNNSYLDTRLDMAILNLFDNCDDLEQLINKTVELTDDLLVNLENTFFVVSYLHEIIESQKNNNTLVLATEHQISNIVKLLTNLGYRVIASQQNLKYTDKIKMFFDEPEQFIPDLMKSLNVFISIPHVLCDLTQDPEFRVSDHFVFQSLEASKHSAITQYHENLEKAKCCNTCYRSESPEKKLLNCSICKKVFYCNVSCQRSNWEIHKRTCNKSS